MDVQKLAVTFVYLSHNLNNQFTSAVRHTSLNFGKYQIHLKRVIADTRFKSSVAEEELYYSCELLFFMRIKNYQAHVVIIKKKHCKNNRYRATYFRLLYYFFIGPT